MESKQGDIVKIKAYTPINWQKEAHKALELRPNGLTLVVKAHRQVGKSLFILNALLFNSINYSGSISYYIAPTSNQSRKVFREMCKCLEGTPLVKTSNVNLMSVEFWNGSEVHFKSAEQKDGALRGFTCKGRGLLCVDEAAYISAEVFANVLNYTNVNNNDVIIVSTPKFESGFFYDLYCEGLKGDKENVVTIDVNDYDTSMFLPEDKKEFYKRTMPTLQYQTDIEGMFIKEFSTVFGEFANVCSNKYNAFNTNYTFGIDWGTGSGGDRTAISVFNDEKQQVGLYFFDDKDPQQTIDYIMQLVDEYQPKKVTVEQNSIGKIYGDMLRKEIIKRNGITFKFFNTSNTSKNKIVNQLQVAIANKTIQLLNNTDLKLEMSNYEVEKTNTGKITYNAASGYHDDLIMATMIAYDSIINKNRLDVA